MLRAVALGLILGGLVVLTLIGAAAADVLSDVAGQVVGEGKTISGAGIALAVLIVVLALTVRALAQLHGKNEALHDRLTEQAATHAAIAARNAEVMAAHNSAMTTMIESMRRVEASVNAIRSA